MSLDVLDDLNALNDLRVLNLVSRMFGTTGKKKKQQKPKKSYNNWFEKCSADELRAAATLLRKTIEGAAASRWPQPPSEGSPWIRHC